MNRLTQKVKKINRLIENCEIPNSRTAQTNKIILSYIRKALKDKKSINFVNIICPGYQKDRNVGVEDFNFMGLSDRIQECPNVISMIEKFERLITNLSRNCAKELSFKKTIILADTAILNLKEIQKKQDAKQTLNYFYFSIQNFLDQKGKINPYFSDISLLRMSRLGGNFQKLKIEGYPVSLEMYSMKNVRLSVKTKVRNYVSELVKSRGNPLKNKGSSFELKSKAKIEKISKLEVLRFLYEYGLAGQTIYKTFPRAIKTFTEPSGHLRGCLYSAFLFGKDYLPVIYLH